MFLPRLLAGVLLTIAFALPAFSQQAFPAREIHFIVPWDGGGANDLAARHLQDILAADRILVVVENAAGANGTIGLSKVANATPNGYTVGMGTSSTISAMVNKVTTLQNKQFESIARISTDPFLLYVNTSSPNATLEKFMDNMKANPAKVSIGIAGTYTVPHMLIEMASRAAKTTYVHIPYSGSSKVIVSMLGEHIDAAILKASDGKAMADAGKIKPIGAFDRQRLSAYPDVPTFAEKGYDVFPFGNIVQMSYVVAPAGLPEPVKQRLIAIFSKAIQSPKFKAFAAENSFLADDLTGKQLDTEAQAIQAAMDKVMPTFFKSDK